MSMDDLRPYSLSAVPGAVAPDPADVVYTGRLPAVLLAAAVEGSPPFEELWALHPPDFHLIKMHGRPVRTPRWQQAYGADYRYTGSVNAGLPIPPALAPFVAWAQQALDARLSGVLCNWYDGQRGHYIGAHRDSTADLIPGSDIVTLSLGAARVFRLRPYRGQGFVDIPLPGGAVLLLPWAVNQRFTHEVPAPRGATGRRLSITLRAFQR